MNNQHSQLIAGFIATTCMVPNIVHATPQSVPCLSPFLSLYYNSNIVILSRWNEEKFLTSVEQAVMANALMRSVTVEYDIS
jgi:hypothetical protein